MNTTNTLAFSVLCLFTLAACSGQGASDFLGRYIWGHEVRSFQPCDSKQVFWVKTSPDIQKELTSFHQANTSKPYEAIYIEFEGALIDEEPTGFALDYDGLILIDKLVLQQAEIPPSCTKP